MNTENFAKWLRLQGYKVIRTTSSYWYEIKPRIFQAFPYHWLITPTSQELSDFVMRNKVLGARFSTPINESVGCISYHAVLEETDYGPEHLGKWARKNVRRGLNRCTVEPISLNRLADEGWALQLDTLTRQGRDVVMTPATWRKCCLSAASIEGFTAWGALIGNKLAASVITYQMNDWAYMLYQQCDRKYLEDHVNNALAFTVTSHLLQQPGIKSILYGLHSLDAPPSVDEFKFRMGYTAKPVRQRVIFNPFIAPLVQPVSHSLLKISRKVFPTNSFLAKTEGMVRFYLQGKQNIYEQEWPDVVQEQIRDNVIRSG